MWPIFAKLAGAAASKGVLGKAATQAGGLAINSLFGGTKEQRDPNASTPQGIIPGIMDGLQGAAVDAVVNPIKGAIAGHTQRRFQQKANPNLNPWEQAGSSASQGAAVSEQSRQEKLMEKQFEQQTKLQKQELTARDKIAHRNNEYAVKQTAMNNDATIQSAALGSEAARAQSPYVINKLIEEAGLVFQRSAQTDQQIRYNQLSVERATFDYLNSPDTPAARAQLKRKIIAKAAGKAASTLGSIADKIIRTRSGRKKGFDVLE